MNPPIAPQKPHTQKAHDLSWQDPYFWLRERENPDVLAYLAQENTYTKEQTAVFANLQETLYKEMRQRVQEADLTVPYRMGDYLYYTRTEEGEQYKLICRKKGDESAPEEILLNENQLAKEYDYFRIWGWQVSPNARYLAYAMDIDGSERLILRIKDLQTGDHLPEKMSNTSYAMAWANDNETLFYITLDEARRPFRLWRHSLHTSPSQDAPIYEETDERFFIYVNKSLSGQYLFLNIGSAITSEVHWLSADSPLDDWQLFTPRVYGVEYSVAHSGDQFFVLTNENAENFKLMATPVTDTSKESWQPFLPYDPNLKIQSVLAFKTYLALSVRENGLRTIQIVALASKAQHSIPFEEPAYVAYPVDNFEFDSTTLRLKYASMVTPETVYNYEMNGRSLTQRKQEPIIGYDATQYTTERIWATAQDGVQVPITLMYKKGLDKDGQNPAYMKGYGSYGASYDPFFDRNVISLADRGFVVATAHIRGGGEMGEGWRNTGKFLHKKNTFTDFIACAEHLIKENYTCASKLAVMGRSAGGLLMGATANMRPDLFEVMIAHVPFVDVINTMIDASIPLTVVEYDEWGDPNDKQFFDYMLSYSPYDNVTQQAYPHMLVTAGLNDPRVQYWEPAKWVAKLRQHKTDNNMLVLETNMGAGHGGASGRFDRLKEYALEYAFIIHHICDGG